MDLTKKGKKTNSKKGKSLVKLINNSDSDTETSEHELSYYVNDRVKLMKEVLKIIKPKKIRNMAPEWMKNLEIEEINSMLLEELLGISNKRLKCIFNGQKLEEDSSSTDPEEEKPVDIISLDDITDDDFIIDLDSDASCGRQKKKNECKVKDEPKKKRVKKEKHDKIDKKKSKPPVKEKTDEENLMSVLELLELQARARAIRSQLALENKKKEQSKNNSDVKIDDSDNDAIIISSPKNIEIVITSSESENEDAENSSSKSHDNENSVDKGNENDKQEEKRKGIEKTTIRNSVNKKNRQKVEDHTDDNMQNKPNNATEYRVGEESENIHISTQQSENGSVILSEKLSANNDKIESEDLTQNITNNLHQRHTTDSKLESDMMKDTSFRKRNNSRKKQSRILNVNNSESENEDSGVKKKQGNSKYKKTNNTESLGVVTQKEQSNNKNEGTNSKELRLSKNIESQYKNIGIDESDGIVINVDQSEIECIISD